ncbi:Hypothetical protein LUCI_0382 [Lucifera butyrica]|uniref:EamA domain-containing protein n=2 Tax=Lucifera butyrica TaxID=1351585 RepID=A0A498R1Y6_9FIRM|nr:Hypothetical protein LUCI_0382 [Lucifera butyrica]
MIKYLLRFFPPLALAPIRLSLAAGLLLPVVWRQYGFYRLSGKEWLFVAGVAFFSIFVHQIVLSLGVAATSGTHAVLILGLNPLLTTVLASYLMKEAFTWAKGAGIALGFSGVALVVYGNAQGTATPAGDLLILVAMIVFVIGSLFVKKSTVSVPPLVVTAYSHALASIGLVLLGIMMNPVWTYGNAAGFGSVAVLLFSSLVNTALGALWWNMGIQQVGASTTSLFQNVSPIVGVFASAVWLNEQLNWHHIAALCLVVMAVSLGTGVASNLNFPSRFKPAAATKPTFRTPNL